MIVQTKMNSWLVVSPRGVGRLTLTDTRTAKVAWSLVGDANDVLHVWQRECLRVPMVQAMAIKLAY